MTGFGQASGKNASGTIGFRVEASSINRKQLEAKFDLPREISFYESILRTIVADCIHRGSVSIRVEFLEGAAPRLRCKVDLDTAARLAEAAGTIAARCRMESNLTAAALLTVPGVVQLEPDDLAREEIESLLREVVSHALQKLVRSRETEGAKLKNDIMARIEILKKTMDSIEPLTQKLPHQQYEKLLAKLRELDLPAKPDDERLLRELVLYIDKLDVTEEITRIHSHFKQFDTLLASGEELLGRQLDFMAQELFREFNTLGNKAASMEVSPLVVVLKTELEKIREQIQNIE